MPFDPTRKKKKKDEDQIRQYTDTGTSSSGARVEKPGDARMNLNKAREKARDQQASKTKATGTKPVKTAAKVEKPGAQRKSTGLTNTRQTDTGTRSRAVSETLKPQKTSIRGVGKYVARKQEQSDELTRQIRNMESKSSRSDNDQPRRGRRSGQPDSPKSRNVRSANYKEQNHSVDADKAQKWNDYVLQAKREQRADAEATIRGIQQWQQDEEYATWDVDAKKKERAKLQAAYDSTIARAGGATPPSSADPQLVALGAPELANRLKALDQGITRAEMIQYERKWEAQLDKIGETDPQAAEVLNQIADLFNGLDGDTTGDHEAADRWAAKNQGNLPKNWKAGNWELAYATAYNTAKQRLTKMGYKEEDVDELIEARKRQINKKAFLESIEASRKFAEKHPVLGSVASVGTNIFAGVGTLDALLQKAVNPDRPINFYSPGMLPSATTEAIRGQVAQDIQNKAKNEATGKVGSFLYQTGMSMADSAVNMAMAAVGIPESVGLSVLGGSAATSSIRAAHERGLSDGQALTLGIISGIAEYATEKIGLDKFMETVVHAGANPRLAKTLLTNMLAEGGEEVASDLVNLFADIAISRDKSEWAQSVQAFKDMGYSDSQAFGLAFGEQAGSTALSFLGGALSGGLMGGGGYAVNHVINDKQGNLILTGLAAEGTNAYAAAQKVQQLQTELSGKEELSREEHEAYTAAVAELREAVDALDPETRKEAQQRARNTVKHNREMEKRVAQAIKAAQKKEKTGGSKETPTYSENATVQQAAELAATNKAKDLSAAATMVLQDTAAQEALGLSFEEDEKAPAKRKAIQEALKTLVQETGAQTETETQATDKTESRAAEVTEAVEQEAKENGGKISNKTAQKALKLVQQGGEANQEKAVGMIVQSEKAQKALGLTFGKGTPMTEKRAQIRAALVSLSNGTTQTQATGASTAVSPSAQTTQAVADAQEDKAEQKAEATGNTDTASVNQILERQRTDEAYFAESYKRVRNADATTDEIHEQFIAFQNDTFVADGKLVTKADFAVDYRKTHPNAEQAEIDAVFSYAQEEASRAVAALDRAEYNKSDKTSAAAVKEEQHVQETESDAPEGGNAERGQHRGESGSGELAGRAGKRSDERSERVSRRAERTTKAAADRRDGHRSVDQRTAEEQRSDQTGVRGSMPGSGGETRSDDVLHRRAAEEKAGANAGRGEGTGRVRGVNTEEAERVRGLNLKTKKMTLEPNTPGDRVVDNQDLPERYRPSLKKAAKLGLRVRWLLGRHVNQEGRSVPGVQFGRTIIASLDSDFRDGLQLFDHEFGHAAFRLVPGLKEKVLKRLKQLGVDDDILFDVAKDNYRRSHEKHYGKLTKDNAGLFIEEFLVDAYAGIQKTQVTDGLFGKVRKVTVALIDGGVDQVAKARGVDTTGNKYFEIDEDDIPDYAFGEMEADEDYEDPYEDVQPEDKHPDVEVGSWEDTGDADVDDGYYDDPGKDEDAPSGLGPEQVIYDPERLAYYAKQSGRLVIFDETSQTFLYDEFGDAFEKTDDPDVVIDAEKEKVPDLSTPPGFTGEDSAEADRKPTNTATEEFRRWFNDPTKNKELSASKRSKKPKTLFHGSIAAGFTKFVTALNSSSNFGGIYLTDDEATAQAYADGNGREFKPVVVKSWSEAQHYARRDLGMRLEENDDGAYDLYAYNEKTGLFEVRNTFTADEAGLQSFNEVFGEAHNGVRTPGVYKLYGTSDNALVIDAHGRDWQHVLYDPLGRSIDADQQNTVGKWWRTDDIVDRAFASGYDCVIFKNVVEGVSALCNDYVFKDPAQVKSVYNEGTWDRQNDDVRYYDEDESEQHRDLVLHYDETNGSYTFDGKTYANLDEFKAAAPEFLDDYEEWELEPLRNALKALGLDPDEILARVLRRGQPGYADVVDNLPRRPRPRAKEQPGFSADYGSGSERGLDFGQVIYDPAYDNDQHPTAFFEASTGKPVYFDRQSQLFLYDEVREMLGAEDPSLVQALEKKSHFKDFENDRYSTNRGPSKRVYGHRRTEETEAEKKQLRQDNMRKTGSRDFMQNLLTWFNDPTKTGELTRANGTPRELYMGTPLAGLTELRKNALRRRGFFTSQLRDTAMNYGGSQEFVPRHLDSWEQAQAYISNELGLLFLDHFESDGTWLLLAEDPETGVPEELRSYDDTEEGLQELNRTYGEMYVEAAKITRQSHSGFYRVYGTSDKAFVLDVDGEIWSRLLFNPTGLVANPLLKHDSTGKDYWDTDDLADFMFSQGYDLVVVKNVTDGSDPDNDDFIFRDPGQIKSIYNVGTWDHSNPDVRYYDEDENEILPPEYSYAEQVEMTLDGSLDSKVKAVIDDNGNRTASAVYVSFDTPNVLRSANLQDLPMLMTQRHLRDVHHTRQEYNDGSPKPGNASYHGISKAKLKKVPALLARPAMILDAPGETHKGDIIVVTTERDYRGRPIVVTIHPNGNAVYDGVEGPANFITSVYGYGKNPGDILGLISLAVRQNRVIYAQKQRSQAIVTRAGDHTRRSEVSGRQLDQKRVSREDYAEKIGLNQLDYDRIIHKIPDPVNGKQLRKFYDEDAGDVGQTPDTFESIVARAEAAYQQAMGDTAARAVTAKDLGSVAQADEALLQWVIHRHQYGAIPQTGSNNARKVEAPKSVDGKKVVSKTVSTVMSAEATPEKRLMTVVSAVEGGKLSHVPITDKVAERRAEATIEKDGFQETRLAWGKEVAKGKASKDLVTLGAALLNNAGNSDATGREYVSILMDYSDLLTRAGQALQAAKMLKKLSPDAKLYVAQKRVDTINAELAKRGLDPSQYGVEIDPELIDAYRRAKTGAERDEIMTLIAQNIADQIPASAMDKFTAWRYLAMLGNLRTQVRNVLGNTTMQPMRMLKADIAGLTEALIQRMGGKIERTQSVLRDRETFKAAYDEFNSVRAVIMGGGKYDDSRRFSQEIEEKRRIFKFIPLEYWRKATNWLMDKGDEVFCSFTYADALSRYIKANGTTWSEASDELKDKARTFAIQEAAEATYRDNNAFSNLVVNLRVKNPDNAVKKAASAVVEGVLPFRKTPANILARTVEYSPLGLLRAAYSTVKKATAKNGSDITGAMIVNQLSKGLTGSGLLALGLMLAAKGVLVGKEPDDDKEKEQWKREGHQAYSLEIGGHSYTLDWMAPSCVPFFLGANLHDAFLEEGLTLDSALSSLRTISDPVLEMSMLQGIQDLIDNAANYGDESALVRLTTDAAWSFVTQLTPTLLGQAERASDNTRYQTYTDKNSWVPTDVQYALGKLSAKIPGWDYGQIVYTDAWGRTHSNTESETMNVIQQFLSPGYLSKIETSEMEKELRRLYAATGDSGVLIGNAQKRVEYTWEDDNGAKHHEKMELTGDQYLTLNRARGQTAYRVLTTLTSSAEYAKMSDEDKAKCVDYAYTYATQLGKAAVAGEHFSPDAWVNNASNAKEDLGITDAEFIAARVKYGTTYFSGATYEKLKEAVNQGVGLEDYVKLHDSVDTFRVSITPQTQVSEYLENSDLPNSQKAVLWAQGVTGSAKDKMDAAIAGGVKLEDYYLMKTHIDADGSGSVTQAEAQAYLDSTNLSRKQKSLLWSLINSGWKKNPYA